MNIATLFYAFKRGDGVGALAYLKLHFDSVAGSGNDRASGMQRMQAAYIDKKNDISENDVRHQYDNMMIAVNDVVNAGASAPDQMMCHLALSENDDEGAAAEWLEPVSETDYTAPIA